MTATKTNERPGTRAVLRHSGLSASKVRQVLDLIRGQDVDRAAEILIGTEREAANIIGKVLASAVANAVHNDGLDAEELFVSACFADEGTTIKRWRPRARGRATRIRKRTSHITVIVSRMPEQQLQRLQARRRAEQLAQRARRVAGARRSEGDQRSRSERRHGGELLEPAESDTSSGDVSDVSDSDDSGDPTTAEDSDADVAAIDEEVTAAEAGEEEDTAAEAGEEEDTAAEAGEEQDTAAEAGEEDGE